MVAVLLVFDGLGDREYPPAGYRTPLEVAQTPNMDVLAREGATGMFSSVGVGVPPGSAAAMLSILGYDPIRDNPGRGVLDALGVGIYREGCLAARANLATVENNVVTDRRAGRIKDPRILKEIERSIGEIEIDGCKIIFRVTLHYRGVIILCANNFSPSDRLLSNDPEAPNFSGTLYVRAVDNSASKTASVLNKWLEVVRERLEGIGCPANFVILRGFGNTLPRVTPFEVLRGGKAAVISGLTYLIGIGKMIGIDTVRISEENMESNVRELVQAIIENKEKYDLLVTHVKATDVYGHDGDFEGKVHAIEFVDRNLVRPLRDALNPESDVIAITGDHSTPVTEKKHTGDPVPLLIWGKGVRRDRVVAFGEHACMQGGLGLLRGVELVDTLLDLIGKRKRLGA